MVANADPGLSGKAEPRRLLQCNVCGRTIECSVGELLRYTREGWPKCCGQVMAFYTEPSRAGSDARPIPPTPDNQS